MTPRTKKATATETKNLAVNLRILRDRTGLSGPAVAARLGINSSRLGHWETGLASPDYTMLVRLCDLYGFTDVYRMLTEVV